MTLSTEAAPREAATSRPPWLGPFLCFLGVTAFSVTLPATRLAVRHLNPWFVSMGRAVIAAALAAIVLAVTRLPRPTRAEARQLLGVAFGVVFGFPAFSTLAVRHMPASHAAITNGLLPLATVGLAMAVTGERPSRRWWTATLVGVAALIIFAVHSGGTKISVGHPLMVVAVLLGAIGYVCGGVLSRTRPGWWVISWGLLFALPVTATVALLHFPDKLDAPASEWAGFAYVSVVSMFLGFFAWYGGLALAGISRGSQIQLIQPVESFVWAAILLGERLGPAELLAGTAVIAALAVGRSRPTSSRPGRISPARV